MLKAIIFDFDGVIANSEPAHFVTFQRVLLEEGVCISRVDYLKRYLAMDDRGAFTTALTDFGKNNDPIYVSELVFRKSSYFEYYLKEEMTVYPDTIKFINLIKEQTPIAINSGALRQEIDVVLNRIGLKEAFPVIISTENITKCKPNPEGYLKALDALNKLYVELNAQPENCLAVEDSVGGIRSAITAGMKCVAVTNTYSKEYLGEATGIVSSLEELTSSYLKSLFDGELCD